MDKEKKVYQERSTLPFVDLFCGAGGLSVGFEQAGFEATFANDYDQFACQTFAYNHPHTHVSGDSVEVLTAKGILEATGHSRIPLVIGGPNCQGVSLRGKRDPDDPKNMMFSHFKRLIDELKPDWFVMENVPGLMHKHNLGLATSIFASLEAIGYKCGGEVLLAADYGVPQLRNRFVLIGNRVGAPILFPNPTHACPLDIGSARSLFDTISFEQDDYEAKKENWLTVSDGIGDLPPIENGGGEVCTPYPTLPVRELLDFQRYCRKESAGIHNHICHKTSEHNIRLIQFIQPGGNWKSIPEEVRPERFKRVALKDHTTTYGRLRWDMPSRTITTYFNNVSAGAFTHPDQHRGISVREGARLQSFPDSFRFLGPLAKQYRQIGNAVPCRMAFYVADLLHKMMNNGPVDSNEVHKAAVEFDRSHNTLRIHRPLQGMRFNLDKYLVKS